MHYAQVVSYLSQVFAVPNFTVTPYSLYDDELGCHGPFDLVLCSGVLYHVTDLVWALRIMFERLVDGGKVLIETMVHNDDDTTLAYKGPRVPGYCWFSPSPKTLQWMMEDVGFTSVEFKKTDALRGLAIGTRERYVTMMQAGTPGR